MANPFKASPPAVTRRNSRQRPAVGRAFTDDRKLLEYAGCVLFTLDLQGRIMGVNEQGEQVTGYTRREIRSKSITEVVAPEHRYAVKRLLHREAAAELDLLHKDGSRVRLLVHSRAEVRGAKPVAIRVI